MLKGFVGSCIITTKECAPGNGSALLLLVYLYFCYLHISYLQPMVVYKTVNNFLIPHWWCHNTSSNL